MKHFQVWQYAADTFLAVPTYHPAFALAVHVADDSGRDYGVWSSFEHFQSQHKYQLSKRHPASPINLAQGKCIVHITPAA